MRGGEILRFMRIVREVGELAGRFVFGRIKTAFGFEPKETFRSFNPFPGTGAEGLIDDEVGPHGFAIALLAEQHRQKIETVETGVVGQPAVEQRGEGGQQVGEANGLGRGGARLWSFRASAR